MASCLLGAACGNVLSTPERFRDTKTAERQLRRGSSTKSDVTRILGAPLGRGGALLPGQTGGPREVWFYQAMQIGPVIPVAPGAPGRAHQQVVLVFFDGERFDGLLWWPADDEFVIQ